MKRLNGGTPSTVVVLAVVLVLVLSSSLRIFSMNQVEDLVGVTMKLEEGLEIVKSRSYEICSNVKWNEVKAAGIKTTETSWKGFLQICERFSMNLGNLRIYVDFEARLMWVYSDPSVEGSDTDVYYVQFTQAD